MSQCRQNVMRKKLREARRLLRQHPQCRSSLTVDSRGRLVLPAQVRHELGIEPGPIFTLFADTLDMRLVAYEHVLRRAKQFAEEYRGTGLLSDESIFERRIEALAEDLKDEDAARLRIWAAGRLRVG